MGRILQEVIGALRVALVGSAERLVAYLPNLISALLILFLGWVIAKVSRLVANRILQAIRFDEKARRGGIYAVLSDVGWSERPALLIEQCVFWLVFFVFLLPALDALKLQYFTLMAERIASYVPSVLASAVILVIGLAIARGIAGSLTNTARKAQIEYARVVGYIVRYFLSLIVIIVTLAQLGVQTEILTVIFAVLMVSAGLSVALALGLGSRALVANLLAGAFLKDHLPEGREIEVQGMRGRVVAVGSVGTEIDRDGKPVTIPNLLLMENVIE